MRVHHIGIIVRNIEHDADVYEKLGYKKIGNVIFDENQHNKILFLSNNEEQIELIEPIDERSTVKNLPTGYAHICYEVENLDEFIDNFKKNKTGVVFTGKIIAPAINNREVMFAYLKNKTIVEFIQSEMKV